MSHESPSPIVRPHRRLPRVPPFYPVPLRATHNGWTPQRQAHFLGWRAAESFAAAWDAALGLPLRRVTIDDLPFLACRGLIRPRFRGGKYVGSRQNPDNTALLRLLARLDRSAHGRHGEG